MVRVPEMTRARICLELGIQRYQKRVVAEQAV